MTCQNCNRNPLLTYGGTKLCLYCYTTLGLTDQERMVKLKALEDSRLEWDENCILSYFKGFGSAPPGSMIEIPPFGKLPIILNINSEGNMEGPIGYKFLIRFDSEDKAQKHMKELSKAHGVDFDIQMIRALFKGDFCIFIKNEHFEFLLVLLLHHLN